MSSGSAEMVFASADADDLTAVLQEFRASQARVRREEAVQLSLAARFASFHEVDHWQGAASLLEADEEVLGSEGELLVGGDGCPWVSEFCVTEFAAATGRSTRSGSTLPGPSRGVGASAAADLGRGPGGPGGGVACAACC